MARGDRSGGPAMSAWAFTVVRNEALLMPYWLRHYRTFCDRLIVYDDESDDGTQRIVKEGGGELRPYPGSGLDDQAMAAFASETYREARGQAEWVVWVDADEFLYALQIKARLAALRADGVTLIQTEGYSMIGDAPPVGRGQIYAECRQGFLNERYGKVCCFDPALDLTFDPGRHEIRIRGDARQQAEPFKLLHYRYFGQEYHRERNNRNWARLTEANKSSRFGFEVAPGYSGPWSTAWYAEQAAQAVEVV